MDEHQPIAGKSLFLSDAHLGAFTEGENNRLEAELIHLIDFCEDNGYQIYILGDLFDYWMEYPDYVPKLGSALLKRFELYNRNYAPTLYITGNHDNWTNGYFTKLNFEVEKDFRTIDADGRTLLVLHGDGLSTPHLGLPRPFWHRVIRSGVFIKLFQSIFSPPTGLKIMKWVSHLNRSADDSEISKKKLNNWAQSQLYKKKAEIIICGHDHHPRCIKNNFGTFINLGTFYKHKTVAVYNNDDFSLVVWNDLNRQLQPFDSHLLV